MGKRLKYFTREDIQLAKFIKSWQKHKLALVWIKLKTWEISCVGKDVEQFKFLCTADRNFN